MKALGAFFKALESGGQAEELREIYARLRTKYSELPAMRTKADMERALCDLEAAGDYECELIPSEGQFYGFSRGANRLAKHVQWIYVPAVKDAAAEQVETRNSSLGKLLARTVRSKVDFSETIQELRAKTQEEYQKNLDETQHILNEISNSLQQRILQ